MAKCAVQPCGELRCVRRKAPTEPSSPNASASPLTILQDSCLVRSIVSEGCCAYPAPPRGCPEGQPVLGLLQLWADTGPCLHSPLRSLGRGLRYTESQLWEQESTPRRQEKQLQRPQLPREFQALGSSTGSHPTSTQL